MSERIDFGFTDAEMSLLRAAVNTNDFSSWWLARLTHYEEGTVRSMFRDILVKLRDAGLIVHDRGCAIRELEQREVLQRDPTKFVEFGIAEDEERERERERERRRRTNI